MCNSSGFEFINKNVLPSESINGRVLEVGSKNINGGVRPIFEKNIHPKEYIGIDIEPGEYVDKVLSAESIVDAFGENSFDIVVSTEMLEHVHDWKIVVQNIKRAVKPGGCIFITTRSYGFGYHGYPHDFWRFEVEDMEKIFSDFKIIAVEKDGISPGVFVKAMKPIDYSESVKLSELPLYSIVLGRRTTTTPTTKELRIFRRMAMTVTRILSNKFVSIWRITPERLKKFGL